MKCCNVVCTFVFMAAFLWFTHGLHIAAEKEAEARGADLMAAYKQGLRDGKAHALKEECISDVKRNAIKQ